MSSATDNGTRTTGIRIDTRRATRFVFINVNSKYRIMRIINIEMLISSESRIYSLQSINTKQEQRDGIFLRSYYLVLFHHTHEELMLFIKYLSEWNRKWRESSRLKKNLAGAASIKLDTFWMWMWIQILISFVYLIFMSGETQHLNSSRKFSMNFPLYFF